MYEIGETLRSARGREKVGIKEVEKVTKIRAKYIQALEDEDFGAIPGATYVKAFLRTYAEYLDLDANALLQQYQEEYGSEGGPTSVAGRSRSSTHVKVGEFGGRNGPGDRLNPLWLILAIAGVAVLAILIWIALAGVPDISLFGASETTLTTVLEEDSGGGSSQMTTSTAVYSVVPADESSGAVAGSSGGPVEMVSQDTGGAEPVEGAAVLTITAVESRCWLTIRQDSRAGRPLFAGALEDGDRVSYSVSSQYWLAIGNPSAVEIQLDGVAVEIDEPYGYFRVGPEGAVHLE